MLAEYVWPELAPDAHPMLQYRALWLVGRYYNLAFKDPQCIVRVAQCTLQLLLSTHLAVRVKAAEMIQHLIKIDEVA